MHQMSSKYEFRQAEATHKAEQCGLQAMQTASMIVCPLVIAAAHTRTQWIFQRAQSTPVASEMTAPRKNTSVDSARLSMALDTPLAMKSSVPSVCMTLPMVHARMSTSVVDTSCLMPSIHALSLSAAQHYYNFENNLAVARQCVHDLGSASKGMQIWTYCRHAGKPF